MNTSFKNPKKTLAGLCVGVALIATPPAFAFSLLPPQLIGIIADFLATSLSYVEQAKTAVDTASQLEQDMKNIEQNAKNLEKLDVGQWNAYIDQLSSLMTQTNGLAYNMASVDGKFDELFPTYDNALNGIEGTQKNKQDNFTARYKAILDNNRGTALGTLKNLKNTGDFLNDDKATLNSLKIKSDNASGNLQVIQAGNAIAVHQTEALNNLHRTMLQQQNLMVIQQQRLSEEQAKQTAMSAKIRTPNRPTLGNEPTQKTW